MVPTDRGLGASGSPLCLGGVWGSQDHHIEPKSRQGLAQGTSVQPRLARGFHSPCTDGNKKVFCTQETQNKIKAFTCSSSATSLPQKRYKHTPDKPKFLKINNLNSEYFTIAMEVLFLHPFLKALRSQTLGKGPKPSPQQQQGMRKPINRTQRVPTSPAPLPLGDGPPQHVHTGGQRGRQPPEHSPAPHRRTCSGPTERAVPNDEASAPSRCRWRRRARA